MSAYPTRFADKDTGNVIHLKRFIQISLAGSGVASLTRAYSELLEVLAKDIEGSLAGFGV